MDTLSIVVSDLQRSMEMEPFDQQNIQIVRVSAADNDTADNENMDIVETNCKTEIEDTEKQKKRRVAKPQAYLKSWETREEFSPWLTNIGNKFTAYCKACKATILARIASIKEHAKSKKHLKCIQNYSPGEDDSYLMTVSEVVSESTPNRWQTESLEIPLMLHDKHNRAYDLCIVGAGMFGSAAAKYASNFPFKVCLVGLKEPTADQLAERDIFGAHYDEGRLASTLGSCYSAHMLAKQSIERFEDLTDVTGVEFHHPTGILHIASENEFWKSKKSADIDPAPLKIKQVPQKDFRKKYPYLHLEFNEVAYYEGDGAGHISARGMVLAQQTMAQSLGCHFLEDTVQKVEIIDTNEHLITTSKSGFLKAKRVLICAGAFTNFNKLLPCKKLFMRLNKESVALLQLPVEEAERLSDMPAVVYHKRIEGVPLGIVGAYVVPPIRYPDDNYYIKIAPLGLTKHADVKSLQEIKEWYNSEGFHFITDPLVKLIYQLIPNLRINSVWAKTCMTSHTATGLPYIDYAVPSIAVAAAGNGAGAAWSDEVGRIAADLAMFGKWDSKLLRPLFKCLPDMRDDSDTETPMVKYIIP